MPLGFDLEVSRAHALLELVGGRWTVVDDGLSRNGTFVNGSRVHGRHAAARPRPFVLREDQSHLPGAARPRAPGVSTAQAPSNAAAAMLSETQRKVLIALCRPVNDSTAATPATNRQIADEIFLSVDAVKAHLRVLFDRFGVGELPQNEKKRARLAAEGSPRRRAQAARLLSATVIVVQAPRWTLSPSAQGNLDVRRDRVRGRVDRRPVARAFVDDRP